MSLLISTLKLHHTPHYHLLVSTLGPWLLPTMAIRWSEVIRIYVSNTKVFDPGKELFRKDSNHTEPSLPLYVTLPSSSHIHHEMKEKPGLLRTATALSWKEKHASKTRMQSEVFLCRRLKGITVHFSLYFAVSRNHADEKESVIWGNNPSFLNKKIHSKEMRDQFLKPGITQALLLDAQCLTSDISVCAATLT